MKKRSWWGLLCCRVGVHRWCGGELGHNDWFPRLSLGEYCAPVRRCTCCGRRERWVPPMGADADGEWVLLTRGRALKFLG